MYNEKHDKEMYVKMKSRKLRAVFAALSAVAVLATAMTGFAATVTTTTEYHTTNNEYAHVTSVVTGANGDVTYLATTAADAGVSSSGILYIDQKPVVDGTVTFDYLVKKSDIAGVETKLALGTNGTESISHKYSASLLINATKNVDAEGYTIEYGKAIYGNGDGYVPAVITAKPGYEIQEVKIDGQVVELAASYNVPVHANGSLKRVEVKAESTYVTPEIGAPVIQEGKTDDEKPQCTAILKPIGTWTEVGVTYMGYEFPATGSPNADGYVAVRLVDAKGVIASGIEAYIK